ncbi:MAG: DUF5309 family protein [Rikenellaceae bacterium]
MKTKQFYFALGLVLTCGAIITYFLTASADVSSVILAFAVPAMVVGETATVSSGEEAIPDAYLEDISKSVTEMLPSRTPLDTVMRNSRNILNAESQKIGYYQASYKEMTDTFNSSATGAGTSSAAPACAHTIVSPGVTSIYLQVNNPGIWRTADTFLLQDLTLPGSLGASVVGGTGTHTDSVMFYVMKKDGDVLYCKPIGGVQGTGTTAGQYIVPTFTSSATLIRMGQAKSELSITTDPFALYPALTHQYCQNFMAQIEQSTFDRITKNEINWGFSHFEAVNVLSMKMEMELSMLFGQMGEYVDGNDKTYFTRGITRDIEKVLEYGSGSGDTTVTKANYNNWLKEVFDGNNGSERRTLFAGSGLIEALSQIDEYQKNIIKNDDRSRELGFTVTSIRNNFGELDIVPAPLFREAGWQNAGVILDLAHLTKHQFVPLQVTNLDLKTSGQKNADARVLQEVSALTLRYPDCHAIIKPKA